MIDPNNREVLARVYRLVEQYETPPKIVYADDAEVYFTNALNGCKEIIDDFAGNDFAWCLVMGVYEAIEKRFKAANELPLKDREKEPEQQSFI